MTVTPRIAIPEPTSTDEAYNQRSLPQYMRAIEAAGGEPLAIRLQASPELQSDLLSSCAAILLPGSPADVDPRRYGQAAVEECAACDPLRERADDLLLRHAMAEGKPVLGICYGLQSLNVWRQGSLIQHLPHPDADGRPAEPGAPVVNHRPGRDVQQAHSVMVVPDSRLAEAMKLERAGAGGELMVNSSHHQAVARPGKNLKVTAISPIDGVVEAMEGLEPGQFLVGVQWHPERSFEISPASRGLFAAFLAAARAWK